MPVPYLRASVAAVAASLWLAPAAFAGTAFVEGTNLRFDAAPGEINGVVVTQIAPGEFRVSDQAPITPGPGCTGSDGDETNSVSCTSDGFTAVFAGLGDRDDSMSFSGVAAAATVDGGEGDDSLGGTTAGDFLIGAAGDDSFTGSLAPDRYDGGPGSDAYLQDESGPDEGGDVFVGGAGVDTASYSTFFDDETGFTAAPPLAISLDDVPNDGRPGEGDNLVDVEDAIGGSGNDIIGGNPESNTLLGGSGNDLLDGGPGIDSVSGGSDNDRVIGGDGADDVIGDSGDDGLEGGPGDDNLFGGSGEDGVGGGSGDDNLDGGSGPDFMAGNEGVDTADYANRFGGDPDDEGFAGNRVVVSLDGVPDDGFAGEGDNATADIENVSTGSGADVVVGNASGNGILTGAGNDIISTRDQAADAVICGPGFDTVRADGLDQVDVEGEDRCERVEVSGAQGPPPDKPGTPARVKPRSLVINVGPNRDRRAPYKFRTRGSVALPAGLAPATSCTGGRVRVTIKRGSKTISSRRVNLKTNCTFTSSVRFSRSRRQARGRLKVSAKFLGNAVLLPSGTKTRSVRAG